VILPCGNRRSKRLVEKPVLSVANSVSTTASGAALLATNRVRIGV
jgi:hypothetical protein